MEDKDGKKISVGDRFLFQFATEHQVIGEIFDCGGVEVIKWDDNDIISVKNFYWEPSDKHLLLKL